MKDVQANPRLNPNLSLTGIIITKYRNNRVMNAYVKKISGDARDVFLGPVVHEEAAVLKAVSEGRTVADFAPDSKAAKAYDEIARELMNRVK